MRTKITKERDQYRTTVPKKLMEESGRKKGDVVEWENKKGKLIARVMSHKEFLEEVKEATSLRAKTKDAFSEGDKK